jgi:signal transduction histidine kinase
MGRERIDLVALYNIAVAVGSNLSLKKVIWQLYEETSRSIDAANFAIVIYDKPTDTLNFYLVFDRGERLKPFAIKHSTNQGLISQIINSRDPLLIGDLAKTELVFEINQIRPEIRLDKPVRAWLGVPFLNDSIFPHESAQGAIAVWNYRVNYFTQRDLWFLTEIGAQAAIAIRNAHLFEASQRRAMEMAVVDDVAQTLSSTLELEEVLRRIMGQVAGILNVGAGFLLLKDPVTGDLVFQFALGKQTKEVKSFRIPRGQGIAGQVAESGKAVFVNKQANGQAQIDFRAHNALCVPLILHEQVIGVLEVLNKRDGNFSQHDLELLSAVATFAAIAIENARLHESVLAERDRVIEAEEAARKALARDFHDGPIQLVAGAIMRLNFCQRIMDKEPGLLVKEIPQTLTMIEQALQQMRTTLFELRPLVLETEGLQAALEIFIERQQQDIAPTQATKLMLKIETTNPYGQISRLDKKIETAIFAIVQEAVSNAIKHAYAGIIKVHIDERPAGLYILVSDNGVGFDVEQVVNDYGQRASLGIINIKERVELIGGDLAIRSAPNQGTRLRVYIPKAQDERLKKRGKTGKLSNSRRIQTGMLAGLTET